VFDRVSFDLIYGLPGQSEAAWAAQLGRALGFGTGHLSSTSSPSSPAPASPPSPPRAR
jgi:coproporphyrinogen III oxidase-like Fe-S oxidoreductase